MHDLPQNPTSPRVIGGVLAGGAAVGLLAAAAVSLSAVLTFVQDGMTALLVVMAGVGLGLAMIRVLRLDWSTMSFQVIAAAYAGLGLLALLVLAGAAAGMLGRSVWWAIVLVLDGAAIVQIYRLVQRSAAGGPRWEMSRWALLWLAAVPFAAILILTVTMPVGFLWRGEAGGYDALEYHLQAPREWYEAGRLTYLPHNAYSNMPFLMEMLYLLAMVLTGGPLESIYVAQMLHASMAGLAVASVWLAGRAFSPAAGALAGVAAASCPWVVYLGSLAFNEWGLCAGLALGLACVLHAVSDPSKRTWRLAALSGLAVGFSSGCKYTGVVMAAIPVGLAWAFVTGGDIRRFRGLAGKKVGLPVFPFIVATAAIAVFSPWVIKNLVYTGNPVFPLGYSVFGGRDWTPELADRWRNAHRPVRRGDDGELHLVSADGRFRELWKEVLTSCYFGPLVLGGPILALYRLARRRTLADLVVWLVLGVQVTVWLTATHLLARFAVPLIVPLAIMVGLAGESLTRPGRAVLAGGVAAAAIWNAVWLARLYQKETSPILARYGDVHGLWGRTIADGWPMNRDTAPTDKILYVGWAAPFYTQRNFTYNVVFNRNPLAEQIAACGGDYAGVVRWLQERGYTHVEVHWSEVRRLATTYGYEKEITPDNLARLVGAGLIVLRNQPPAPGENDARTLYAVPAARKGS